MRAIGSAKDAEHLYIVEANGPTFRIPKDRNGGVLTIEVANGLKF